MPGLLRRGWCSLQEPLPRDHLSTPVGAPQDGSL